ncbi:hypothetical protein HU200_003119 [Digitaria exilis]|uniref:Phytocyanin domain-containing protein n=1 Tax=Digitaria exilis TaxID=1010633 RepID=A0A835FYE5_9POAL|nr:hypothetical protein HU200_003119 [Digitaria exilis]
MCMKGLLALTLGLAMAATSSAVLYKVGDNSGWTILNNINYTDWTSKKTFHVGDIIGKFSLLSRSHKINPKFKYPPGIHNVLEVKKADYDSCSNSTPIATHTSGDDKITIKSPGHRFFICGVPGHCTAGQKLNIRVLKPSDAPSKAPSPAPPAPAAASPTTGSGGSSGSASPPASSSSTNGSNPDESTPNSNGSGPREDSSSGLACRGWAGDERGGTGGLEALLFRIRLGLGLCWAAARRPLYRSSSTRQAEFLGSEAKSGPANDDEDRAAGGWGGGYLFDNGADESN